MKNINYPGIEPTYFCAFPNDESFLHYGKLMSNNCLGTSQDNLEEFTDQSRWISRCSDFGVTIDPATDLSE
jgi:hypothetical protein